jgi:hypothetical protein
VADAYPEAKTIHLVMDNLNTHRRKALVDRYGEQEGMPCGTGLPCITRPNTAVGSIRLKSKLAYWRANAWANGGWQIFHACAMKCRPGIRRPIASASRFSGSLTVSRPEKNFVTIP